MIKVEKEFIVPASIDQFFAFIENFENDTKWNSNTISVGPASSTQQRQLPRRRGFALYNMDEALVIPNEHEVRERNPHNGASKFIVA